MAGLAAAADPAAGTDAGGASVNLVPDPNFNHGASAWTVTSGTRSTVVVGHAGHRALRITNASRSAKTVNLNDKVNTVASTTAGGTYIASAWIRAPRPTLSVGVREGEWKGSKSQANPALKSAWLTDAGWHFVSVTYRAVSTKASVDLNVLAWQLRAGGAFDVSEPSLTMTPPVSKPTPVPTPVSSTTNPVPTSTPTSPASTPTSSQTTPNPTSTPSATNPPVTVAPTTQSPTPSATPPSSDGASGSAPADYKLVWEDNFDGSSVDAAKWHVRNNTWGTNELSLLTSRPDNVFVSNGVLTLRAQRETYSAYSQTRAYTSGYLDTIGIKSQKFGRWEMRAKLPTAKGLWPAFWLRSDHTKGEVDILEAVGGLPQMTSQTVLQSTYNDMDKRTHTHNVTTGGGIAGWHTYGFTWTPLGMSWDIDGVEVYAVQSSQVPWLTPTFDDTMNIRLNLQVGGAMPNWWKQPVDSTSEFPASYQIDYVRVYQK